MEKIVEGKLHTKESIVEGYGNLVHHCAHRLKVYAEKQGFSYEDIVSEGFIGLLRAFEAFDEKRGLKFSTIAYSYVYGIMRNAIRDRGGNGLYYSNNIKELAYEIQKAELENEPINVIAARLEKEIHNIAYALKYLKDRAPTRLDSPIFLDDGELTIMDVVGFEDDETVQYVNDFIKTLPKRERTIVKMRMEEYPQREIGKVIGVSQFHVSRLLGEIRRKYIEHAEGSAV